MVYHFLGLAVIGTSNQSQIIQPSKPTETQTKWISKCRQTYDRQDFQSAD